MAFLRSRTTGLYLCLVGLSLAVLESVSGSGVSQLEDQTKGVGSIQNRETLKSGEGLKRTLKRGKKPKKGKKRKSGKRNKAGKDKSGKSCKKNGDLFECTECDDFTVPVDSKQDIFFSNVIKVFGLECYVGNSSDFETNFTRAMCDYQTYAAQCRCDDSVEIIYKDCRSIENNIPPCTATTRGLRELQSSGYIVSYVGTGECRFLCPRLSLPGYSINRRLQGNDDECLTIAEFLVENGFAGVESVEVLQDKILDDPCDVPSFQCDYGECCANVDCTSSEFSLCWCNTAESAEDRGECCELFNSTFPFCTSATTTRL